MSRPLSVITANQRHLIIAAQSVKMFHENFHMDSCICLNIMGFNLITDNSKIENIDLVVAAHILGRVCSGSSPGGEPKLKTHVT